MVWSGADLLGSRPPKLLRYDGGLGEEIREEADRLQAREVLTRSVPTLRFSPGPTQERRALCTLPSPSSFSDTLILWHLAFIPIHH